MQEMSSMYQTPPIVLQPPPVKNSPKPVSHEDQLIINEQRDVKMEKPSGSKHINNVDKNGKKWMKNLL